MTACRDHGDWVLGHHSEIANNRDSLNGQLDDVRIYNRLLNTDEIKQLSDLPGLLNNDEDPEGDDLTVKLSKDVENGDLNLNDDGTFTYKPNDDYFGTESFQYIVTDGEAESEPTTVTIEVIGIPPVAENDNNYQTLEDTQLFVRAEEGVLANDQDEEGSNSTLTAELVKQPTFGTVTLDSDGSFLYKPNDNYYGIDAFTYVAKKGDLPSEVARVSITVTPVFDESDARDDAYQTEKNKSLVVDAEHGVLANDFGGDTRTKPLLPGHILFAQAAFASHLGDFLFVYTPWGQRIDTIQIPKPGDSGIRGVDVDQNGNVQIFNGTFEPRLTTFNPEDNSWSHRTFSRWSSVNHATTGGLAADGPYVFVTDQKTAHDSNEHRGVIRFNIEDNMATRFATNIGDVEDVSIGLDGLLYVLPEFGCCQPIILVYDPETMQHLRTIKVPHNLESVIADVDGRIFGTPGSHLYEPDGTPIETGIPFGAGADVDMSIDGRIVGASFNDLWVTDREFTGINRYVTRELSIGIGNTAVVPTPRLPTQAALRQDSSHNRLQETSIGTKTGRSGTTPKMALKVVCECNTKSYRPILTAKVKTKQKSVKCASLLANQPYS